MATRSTPRFFARSLPLPLVRRRGFSSTAAARADVTHAVIGGGVVGLAVARELAGREGTSTILLERHDAPGTETSSRNSEVIHAGLYYGSDTLKARLCIQGKEMLYDLLQRQGLPYRNTGKWLVAQDAVERDSLERMHEHAQRIGVPTRFLSQQEQERREPEVRALAGVLESPTTGIFDSHSLITYLQGDLEHRGGDCAFLTRVTGLRHLGPGQGYEITAVSADGAETAITAETVVNSAGLGACAVSNMLLPAERHRTMHYAKGTYLSYAASFPKTSVLVYPAVTKAQAGLGIHLTLDMGGQIRFGPDSEWVDSPEDLAPNPARLEPALPLIKKYLPNVDVNAISVSYCGIRPKLSKTSGSSFGSSKVWQDFEIREEEGFPGFINLLGIESPGLTSSLAIGKMVKEMLY